MKSNNEIKGSLMPYGLITGEAHECPLPPMENIHWLATWEDSLTEAQLTSFDYWFYDGFSFYVNDSPEQDMKP